MKSEITGITRQPQSGIFIQNVGDLERIAELFTKSGYFKDSAQLHQASVKILAGLEMGLGAFEAMNGIHIIHGRPVISATTLAAKVKASAKYDYEVLVQSSELCKVLFYEKEDRQEIKALKTKAALGEMEAEEYFRRAEIIGLGISSFSAADAKRAGTQNMGKYPQNMLFHRAMSNGVKFFCPDVFNVGVYVEGELTDSNETSNRSDTDDNGIIDVTPTTSSFSSENLRKKIEALFSRATDIDQINKALEWALAEKQSKALMMEVAELHEYLNRLREQAIERIASNAALEPTAITADDIEF